MKHNSFLRFTLFTVVMATAAHLGCSRLSVTGGSDNPDFRVVGMVADANYMPATNTQVKLIPSSYNPMTDPPPSNSLIDTTNSYGYFELTAPGKGRFNIQAIHLLNRNRLLVSDLIVASESTYVSPHILRRPGVIKIELTGNVDTTNGYIYIPGTEFAARLSGLSRFVNIDSVPAGSIQSIYYAHLSNQIQNLISYDIQVPSGDTLFIPYSRLEHYVIPPFLNEGGGL